MAMKKLKKNTTICEVYTDNFLEEIKKISILIEKYKYITMDTEFPGIVYQYQHGGREAYYRTVKQNVDNLKLIQLGITLTDEEGNTPDEISTWQFNLKFNLNSDQYSNESIALLTNSGINFELLENRGIPADLFGEYMISSGLILNDELYWVSFHGIYDFAYYLKSVTNLPLPESEGNFFETLVLYFPKYYDIRHLVRYNDSFRGSLSKLGHELGVARVGTQHQAGSDSLITSEIFFKLKKEYLSDDALANDVNVLYGIGNSEESEGYQNTYFNRQQQYEYNQGYYVPMQYQGYGGNRNYMTAGVNTGYGYNPYNSYMYQMNNNTTGSNNNRYNLKSNVED
jgi:CCR4-NOT transcription complex subunit 7/8